MNQLLLPNVIVATPDGLVIIVFSGGSDPIRVFLSWDALQRVTSELTNGNR